MPNQFFEQPILNAPYAYPGRHWELDADGQPTNNITESRRRSSFITPVPKPKKRRDADAKKQTEILFPEPENISTAEQQYDTNTIINEIRQYVDRIRHGHRFQPWRTAVAPPVPGQTPSLPCRLAASRGPGEIPNSPPHQARCRASRRLTLHAEILLTSPPDMKKDPAILHLNLHRESFAAIAAGTKNTEYRAR